MPISSRLLDDDEELLVDLRPHWIFMFGPAVLSAVAVAVAITVAVRFPKAPVAVAGILVVMVAVPVVWLAARIVRWLGISLVVTTNRLVYRRGVFGRDLVQIRLQRIAEVHCTQTVGDRLIGSGRLVVEIVGESSMAIEDVRRPRALQRVITRQLDELAQERRYRETAPSGFGDGNPATAVPAHPISVPQPFTFETPPHGTPVTLPGSVLPPIPAPAHPSSLPPGMGISVAEQLIQLDDLRRRGIISEGEFEAKKVELLSRL